MRRELHLLYSTTEDNDLRRQIELLETVFTRPNPKPAVRSELNRIRRDRLTGAALIVALTRAYSVYGLGTEISQPEATTDDNDELSRVVCSEALNA